MDRDLLSDDFLSPGEPGRQAFVQPHIRSSSETHLQNLAADPYDESSSSSSGGRGARAGGERGRGPRTVRWNSRVDEVPATPPDYADGEEGAVTWSSRTTTTKQACMNLIKIYFGTGIICFPYAVKVVGLGVALPLLLVIILINNYTLKLVVRIKQRLEKGVQARRDAGMMEGQYASLSPVNLDFDEMGRETYGDCGAAVIKIALVASLLGCACAYVIFVDQVLDATFESAELFLCWGGGKKLSYWAFIITPILILLACVRSMRFFARTSLFGNFCMVVVLGLIVGMSLEKGVSISAADAFTVTAENLNNVPIFYGIAAFAFVFHNVIPSFEASMKRPQDMLAVMDGSAAVAYVVFAVIGVVTYLAFGDIPHCTAGHRPTAEKPCFPDIVLFLLPPPGVSALSSPAWLHVTQAVQSAMALSIVFTYPMQLFPVIGLAEKVIFHPESLPSSPGGTRPPELRKMNSIAQTSRACKKLLPPYHATDCRMNLTRALLVIFTVAIAVIMGDLLAVMLGLVGAVACVTSGLIMPPLMAFRAFRDPESGKLTLGWFDIVACILTVVVGLVGMVVTSKTNLETIVQYFSSAHDACGPAAVAPGGGNGTAGGNGTTAAAAAAALLLLPFESHPTAWRFAV